MCMFGGGSSAAAQQQRAEAQARQAQIKKGTESIEKTFGGFNDSYFDGTKRDYLNFALPQVHDQFKSAHGDTLFNLARSGRINTASGANKLADLHKTRDMQLGNITGQAHDFANEHRQRVNNEKRSLISALNASGDASQASSLAAQSAGALANAPTPNTIGNLFANFTALGAIDADAKRAGDSGLFNFKRSSPKSHSIVN